MTKRQAVKQLVDRFNHEVGNPDDEDTMIEMMLTVPASYNLTIGQVVAAIGERGWDVPSIISLIADSWGVVDCTHADFKDVPTRYDS